MKITNQFNLILAALVLAVFSQTGMAASEESAKELAVALGFPQSFKEQKESVEEQGFRAADQIVARALQGVQSLSEDSQKKITKVRDQYLKNVSGVVNVDGLLDMYVKLLAPRLTQQEMDKILAFYKTPEGKKYAKVAAAVTKDFTFRMMSQINQDMIQQVNGMSSELTKIVQAEMQSADAAKATASQKRGMKKVDK